MHKKNYIDFARMVKKQRHIIAQARIEEYGKDITENPVFLNGAEKQLNIIIDELVTIFKNDNPAFDVNKFLSACEISIGE